MKKGKKPTVLLNLCTFPVVLRSPVSIKGKLFKYCLVPNLSATFAIMSHSLAPMEVILLDVYPSIPFNTYMKILGLWVELLLQNQAIVHCIERTRKSKLPLTISPNEKSLRG